MTTDEAAFILRAAGYRVTLRDGRWIVGLSGGKTGRELVRLAERVVEVEYAD